MQVELSIVVHTCRASSYKAAAGELQDRSVSLLKRKKEKKLEFQADKMAQQVWAPAAKPDNWESHGENQVLQVVL